MLRCLPGLVGVECEAPSDRMERERIGKYKIASEQLGRGAMGDVYRAQDAILNREVASRRSDRPGRPSANRGVAEALPSRGAGGRRLSHPNIVTVHDFGEEQGLIYMAMELLEGKDLRDALADGDLLATLDDKLRVMEQVMAGLSFAHSKGVIHRDLKPANIHIQPSGQVKIVDFGLARLVHVRDDPGRHRPRTPNYMSPEQALGDKIDARSDVFAAGAVFYEALTGYKPFDAESTPGVLFQVVHKQPGRCARAYPKSAQILAEVVEKAAHQGQTQALSERPPDAGRPLGGTQALEAGRGPNATLAGESQRALRERCRSSRRRARRTPPLRPRSSTARPRSRWTSPRTPLVPRGCPPLSPAALPRWSIPAPRRRRRRDARSFRWSWAASACWRWLDSASATWSLTRARPAPPLAADSPVRRVPGAGGSARTQDLVRDQLQLAERDLEDKNYGAAIDQADKVLKLDGRNARQPARSGGRPRPRRREWRPRHGRPAGGRRGDTEKASVALDLLNLDPRHRPRPSCRPASTARSRAGPKKRAGCVARSRADADVKAWSLRRPTRRREAATRLPQGDFAEATRGFLEARDAS